MGSNTYDIGDLVRVAATFNIKNTLTDPTNITLKVQDGSGNETTYTYGAAEITRDAVGQYHKDISIDEDGTWYYRWEGTGAAVAAEEQSIIVKTSEF